MIELTWGRDCIRASCGPSQHHSSCICSSRLSHFSNMAAPSANTQGHLQDVMLCQCIQMSCIPQ